MIVLAAGWSSLEARRAHNPKVAGSNPAPATKGSWPVHPICVGQFHQKRADLARFCAFRQRSRACLQTQSSDFVSHRARNSVRIDDSLRFNSASSSSIRWISGSTMAPSISARC